MIEKLGIFVQSLTGLRFKLIITLRYIFHLRIFNHRNKNLITSSEEIYFILRIHFVIVENWFRFSWILPTTAAHFCFKMYLCAENSIQHFCKESSLSGVITRKISRWNVRTLNWVLLCGFYTISLSLKSKWLISYL